MSSPMRVDVLEAELVLDEASQEVPLEHLARLQFAEAEWVQALWCRWLKSARSRK